MSKKVRETDLKALIKSFFGMDEEDFQSDGISDEEAIKKCNEVTEEVKSDLLNSVKNRAKLEAILDYSPKTKTKKSKLKISRDNNDEQEKGVNSTSRKNIVRDER